MCQPQRPDELLAKLVDMPYNSFALSLAGDVILGGYTIPLAVWNAIYGYVRTAGHVSDPFRAGNSCWKLACYLGIAAVESASTFDIGIEGDAANSVYSGPGGTCCTYYSCLDAVACPGGVTAWDRARAHAPYGSYGAYLSHGIYQLYVCGQGSAYICDPAQLHDLGIHMSIALYWISRAVTSQWSDSNIELSVRQVCRESGHPGWDDLYHPSYTSIWNATQAIQPDLYAFLLGNVPPPSGRVVTLFEHIQYMGRQLVLTADTIDFNPLGFNDIASSIKIEGGTGTPAITLFQHTGYQGAAIIFSGNDPDFGQHMMTDTLSWNDQASSLKMVGAAPPPPAFPPGPLPPFPVPAQILGPSPLPPFPYQGTLTRNPLPPLPS